MKFTLSWLKDHLNTSASIAEITTKLTSLGLEVEGIHNPGEKLQDFIVAEVIEAVQHPNADRLRVCKVATGKGDPLQIVCGAPNARAGIKVVLAQPGVTIPATGTVLKVGKVRDVESFGMMCSASELGLDGGHEGIIELDSSAIIGESFATYASLDDPIIEIGVTPNRSDCLGVRGVARDLAAAGLGTLKPLKIKEIKGLFDSPVNVTIDKDTLKNCPHFMGRYIKGVKNGPSPDWLQQRLKSIGLTPISALVDITNYLAYDLGRPLHVFDGDKIKGNALQVRSAKAGESLVALNHNTYALQENMTVIADDSSVLAIGGIMGSESSGCTDDTENIFLEAAYFDPINITETGRKLAILSDARYRFERGIDPESTAIGIEIATQLILECCGGEASHVVQAGHVLDNQKAIKIDFNDVKLLTGVDVPKKEAIKILENLGCSVDSTGTKVTTPSWRHDLAIPQDLIEEIIRIHGYEHIPTISVTSPHPAPLSLKNQKIGFLKRQLAEGGLNEVITWSMVDHKTGMLFGLDESLRISNPISLDLECLRPTPLCHLILAAARNQTRSQDQIALFEIGPAYHHTLHDSQQLMAAGVRYLTTTEPHWAQAPRPFDIFDAKKDLFMALDTFGIDESKVQLNSNGAPSWYHPGRSAVIQQGPKNILGYFGELHPLVAKKLGIKGRPVCFELFIDRLPIIPKKTTNKGSIDLSPYQVVERDFAFLAPRDLPAATLIKTIQQVAPDLIAKVTVFDLYEGDKIKADRKSITLKAQLVPKEGTLTDMQIKEIYDKIIAIVQDKTGAMLRL